MPKARAATPDHQTAYRFPGLELFGAAVATRLRQLIRQRTGARITVNYSSNEMSLIATMDDNTSARSARASRRALSTIARRCSHPTRPA